MPFVFRAFLLTLVFALNDLSHSIGVFWGGTTSKEPQRVGQVWGDLLQLFNSGKLQPVVMQPVYQGLEQVVQALQDLQDRKTWGKAVVRIRDPPSNSKL